MRNSAAEPDEERSSEGKYSCGSSGFLIALHPIDDKVVYVVRLLLEKVLHQCV